jgi:hypothetical protein
MMAARVFHLLRRLATIAAMLASTSVDAQGQFAPGVDVRQGMPLRVYVRDGPPRESALAYVSPSALHLRERCDSCTAVLAIPWSDVTRVDARMTGPPSGRRILAGGLVGASATVVTLALLLTAVDSRCDWDRGSCPGLDIAIAAPSVILAGTGLGMIIGSQMRVRTWVQIR